MQNEEITIDILNDLQNANKYIFVQDFVTSEKILKSICQREDKDYEVFFRRIDVALKNKTTEALLLDFLEHQKTSSDSKALELAILLLKLKTHKELKKTNNSNYRDDFPLRIDLSFGQQEKLVRLPQRKFKVKRSPSIPDDITPPDLDELNYKVENPEYNEVIHQIFYFLKMNPQNYAACYVTACALEQLENLQEAIHYWKQAFQLNPNSMCTLSVLAELQLRGYFHENKNDYCTRLENFDKYLIHGHIETHTDLYNEFMSLGEFRNAIASLKILSDWILRQCGNIPVEIKVICLLGIMNAYKLDKNLIASEACKNEVENVIISFKKSTQDYKTLWMIAELCEEYELTQIAKICYYTILTGQVQDKSMLRDVASHCVNHYPSEALLFNLKTAYENSKGDADIRFCILLCSLNIKKIDPVEYMQIKNEIRELIFKNEITKSLTLIEELNSKFNEDSEIHYYLGEIYAKNGSITEALSHFQQMYYLDCFNSDSVIKYIYFLLKNKLFINSTLICKSAMKMNIFSPAQLNEVQWALSVTYFAEEKYDASLSEITKSVMNDPWNISYISLYLRCLLHLTKSSIIPEAIIMIAQIEKFSLEKDKFTNENEEDLLENLTEYSAVCLKKGFFEIAWLFAKCALIVKRELSKDICLLLSKTAAAYLTQETIPQLLNLIKKQSHIDISFVEISGCIAKTYSLAGQWELVDEWISMAQSQNNEDKMLKANLFELKALSLIMQGSDFKKAQSLLEAAIACYESSERIPQEIKILHGYILVAQGHIAQGMDKIKSNINENTSIQGFYFFIKGLERAGTLNSMEKESIDKIIHIFPLNTFEQKMVEEIYYTVSSKVTSVPMGLAS